MSQQKAAELSDNARLEMFSDGVFAIAITLLILEIKIPAHENVHSVNDLWQYLGELWPSFFALTLSFGVILISWIGHHNLMKLITKTSSHFQLANGFMLFTVIIIPFPTWLMAEYLNTPFAQPAIVVYCSNSILHNFGWRLLIRYCLVPHSLAKDDSHTAILRKIKKGNNIGLYVYTSIALLAWWLPYVALVICVLVWLYWLYLGVVVKV